MTGAEDTKRRLPVPERREQIIASARAALVKGGLRGFGLAVVAKEAGVAIGLIGHHFGGIDGLIKALLHSVVAAKKAPRQRCPKRWKQPLLPFAILWTEIFTPVITAAIICWFGCRFLNLQFTM